MISVIVQRSMASSAVRKRQDDLRGWDLSFSLESPSIKCFSFMLRNNDNIKGHGIKESDAINVILFDTVALLNLTEV